MPFVSGPELDAMVKELAEWYYVELDALMEALTEGYPFGATKLTPAEQYLRYREMAPEDWREFIINLEARYRGFPDARQRVQSSIDTYVARMEALGGKVGTEPTEPSEAY
jgi:hypothetical protein